MAGALMSKVWNLFGMDQADEEEDVEEDVYDYDYEDEEEAQPVEEKKGGFIKRNSKVVSMPQAQSIKMVISQPTSFEQSEEICGFLKERKSVL